MNNDCAQAYFSLCSPFSILGSSSFPSACNYFWLALTLCQYHQMTNNDCAQAYFSLCSPFSILGSSSFPSACNYFWLALTLCQYHHPRWRQSSTEIYCMSALQATAVLGWLFTSIYEKPAQK